MDQASVELRDNIPVLCCSTDTLIVSFGEITESLRMLDVELTEVSSQLYIHNEELEENGSSCIILRISLMVINRSG